MGAPVIIIERMFSGRECISSLEAAAAIAFNQNQVKEKTGDGIHEAEDVQDLIKTEVNLVLQYSLDSYNRQNSTFSWPILPKRKKVGISAISVPKASVNPFGKMLISRLFELVVFIA